MMRAANSIDLTSLSQAAGLLPAKLHA